MRRGRCSCPAPGVIRGDAAHGLATFFFAIAGVRVDLEFARGRYGIFLEDFVEVTETEEWSAWG